MARQTKGKTTSGGTKLRLRIERDRLDWGVVEDLQAIQEVIENKGQPSFRQMRAVVARFAIGEDDEYLSPEAAAQAIRAVPFDEINSVYVDLSRGVSQVILPPVNSNA